MAYPGRVSSGVYSVDSRKYRQTAFQFKRAFTAGPETTESFKDTPDIYEDEPNFECTVPRSLNNLKNKIDKCKLNEEAGNTVWVDTEDKRIKVIDNKKWVAFVSVPDCFMGALIGTNRRSLNALENDTQCRVKTPRKGEKKQCEVTSIISIESVQRCLDRIQIFLDDARKKARPTHFVAVPCNFGEIQDNVEKFKTAVLESDEYDASCKNPQLFTKTHRLHFTLAVVKIFDDHDYDQFIDAFKTLETGIRKIVDAMPVAKIYGIDMMNDDPTEVSVLFAKVIGPDVQKIADYVYQKLLQTNLCDSKGGDTVKLHMTLMNSRYVSQSSFHKRVTFNAMNVLENFKKCSFGNVQIKEICFCPLSSSDAPEQFYEKVASIQFAD